MPIVVVLEIDELSLEIAFIPDKRFAANAPVRHRTAQLHN
jgi:hypothetical protein